MPRSIVSRPASLSFFALPVLAAGLLGSSAPASERRFTYTYEATTAPKGHVELEQWFTFKDYDDRQRYEFRSEIEFGVTDRFQLGVYFSDWRHTDNDSGKDLTEWRTAGLEAIYSLTDPTTDVIGSALYGEVLLGPEKFALEGKLLLQKNFGPLALAYNFVLEAEWEGESLRRLDERVGVIENVVGASYQISPSFFIGAEALHEVEFADWQDAGDHVFYAGPNFSFRKGSFFATATALRQLGDVEGEADTQVRVIAGFHF
jgi:hypothetical protein